MDRSTCIDSVVERRALRENVFPKLRELCRHTLGLDLRVIDPFESSDSSRWPDIKIRQQLIKECRESSAGPFLLYGTASLPTQVEVSEYQLLLQESQQAGVSTTELEREYQRDENSIPPSYCLRFSIRQAREKEEIQMKTKEEGLGKMIQTTVSLCVHKGLMTQEKGRILVKHEFETLHNGRLFLHCKIIRLCQGKCVSESFYFPSFIRLFQAAALELETTPTDGKLLSELCDNFLPGLITSSQLLVYTTATECDLRHGYTTARRRGYAESLCQQVYCDLSGVIGTGDALFREQLEQEELTFLLQIRVYVEQSEQQCPLVVTGGPCTGKTVLLAHCAKKVRGPTGNHVSDHGLSTTSSLDLSGIMKPDICLSELKERLSSLLSIMPSTNQPLILILVGLDRIEKTFGLEISKILPSPLPPSVKLILSVSTNRTQVLQGFNQQSPTSSVSGDDEKKSGYVCLQLGPVDRKQCSKMLASLLKGSGRRVTSGQQALVNQALTSCCLPLYARLLHHHTSLWHSDSDVTISSLPDFVHSSISALLDHLEHKHGRSIVARAIPYLTLSRTGLTEAELADLLSSDAEVQSEHSSNTKVLQVDVDRLLLDLREFLIRRTVGGSKVLFWVCRHFKLVAARKYFGSPELKREIHLEMVDYFSGKSKTNNKVAQMETPLNRQQSSKPFMFTSSSQNIGRVNLRKVSELPLHLQESNKWEELEHGLLLSLGFHQTMIQAGLLRDLVAMLEHEEGTLHFGFWKEKAILASILKSCSCSLQSSLMQLPTLMETSLVPYLEVFPALECYVSEIREERKKRGRGLGVVLCPAPSSVPSVQCSKRDAKCKDVSVREAAVTECGVVVEVMDDGTAWVCKGQWSDVVKLSLSPEQQDLKFAGVKSSTPFILLSTLCNKLFLWDVSGPQMFLQVKDPLKTESGQPKLNKLEGFVASTKKLFVWWEEESFVSVFDIFCDTTTHFQCQGRVSCLACSSDSVYMYCGQEEGKVSIFDTNNGSLLSMCSNSDNIAVTSIILCEDTSEMACVDKTGNVTLWELVAKSEPPVLVKEICSGGESITILNTDYSDEHNTLLVCHSHQVTLWGTHDWELWDRLLAPQGRAFTQALLSHDGHLFLALLDDCPFILVWRVSTGECVLSLDTNRQPHSLLKTASDVICVADDGCLTVWDSEMIETAGTAPKMGSGVKEVVVEGTGEWFYTANGSEMVWRWGLRTGLPHAFFLHDGPVEKLHLSPDNVHLVTLSGGEIYIWQTETGQNILRISGSGAKNILITPNSLLGVSISDQYLSRVWKLSHGSIVCSIRLYLSDAQVSPESTFLIGRHKGDLLAASLWTGSISKRFSCVTSSECVVAFSTLSEHPDFVVVMAASGAVYTWKVVEETVCRHFQLPHTFLCQPQDFHMSSNGNYALLSIKDDAINILDLSQVRLSSLKANGPVIKACLDNTGCYVAYIFRPNNQEESCVCSLHARLVLTVVRLADGERIGSASLCKNPSTVVMCKQQQRVFVGFQDGSVGVYSICDVLMNKDESVSCREKPKTVTHLTLIPPVRKECNSYCGIFYK
uniref:NACHT and WD repeat domain-containing protein 2-like n=1 Tax=Labrus bergylta TaxID=56723 RepID=A0A3Q3FW50_9LABR